jgi:hypothetical protein
VIPCTTTERHATVLDSTTYVDTCTTVEGTIHVDGIALLTEEDRDIALRVMWMGSACDDAPLITLRQATLRYALDLELPAEACGPEDIPHEVRLIMNADLFATAIDATIHRAQSPTPVPTLPPPTASETFSYEVGSFEISARAGKATYRTGEPIDISGQIVWNGEPGTTLEVFGGYSDSVNSLVQVGWEQLGTEHLQIGPVIRNRCRSTVLESGVPLSAPIGKETGNFGDRDHDEFWADFFADPVFTLPPGRYRVMARVSFSVGACRGDMVGAYVPIFINVVD